MNTKNRKSKYLREKQSMKSVTVKLGERDYTIVQPKGVLRAQEWRKKVNVVIDELFNVVELIKNVEISKISDVIVIVEKVRPLLIERLEQVPEWLFDYSPALQADRDYIMESAYEDEIYTAFVEVLKLAYPFGRLVGMFPGLQLSLTGTNSAAASGESTETT